MEIKINISVSQFTITQDLYLAKFVKIPDISLMVLNNDFQDLIKI